MASLRLFVAMPLPGVVEEKVAALLGKVSEYREVRWVSRAQLHITLRFIGDFEEALLPQLEAGLAGVSSRAGTFEAEMGGVGAFPRLDRPRILLMPVTGGEGEFRTMEVALSSLLGRMGVKPDIKEYHPHLTLGRVQDDGKAVKAVRALQENFPARWEPWAADRFVLFKSQLRPEGAVYTRLREFEFGKG